MSKAKDMTGQKVGRLTFVSPTEERSKTQGVIWELLCDCGNTHFCAVGRITRSKGAVLSCGCLYLENRYKPLEKRFWNKVNKGEGEGCWEWHGTTNSDSGYGQLKVNDHFKPAHRVSYELAYGPIPPGMLVCHTCDNPPCVRPNHLFLGTHQDNATDMVNKGRSNFGERSPVAKLTEEQVIAIRAEYATGTVMQKELAVKYSISKDTISSVVKRKTWKHLPD